MEIIQSMATENNKKLKNNLVQEIFDKSLNDNNDTQHRRLLFQTPLQDPTLMMNGNLSFLMDNLILTSAAMLKPDIIKKLDIRCVINAAPELPFVPLNNEITFHRVNILDVPDSNIANYFDEVADIIEEASLKNGKILIFCVAGVSRSATLCIGYFMKYHQLTLLEAYNYVKMRRSKIKPNCGFFKQLIIYEKTLFMNSTVRMIYNEFVKMSIPDVYNNEYQSIRNRKIRNNKYKIK